jgi:hypothetical protein
MVTPSRVLIFTLTKSGVSWKEYLPTTAILLGSGTQYVADLFMKISPEMLMALAVTRDKMSGGVIRMWEYGKSGIESVTLPMNFIGVRLKVSRALNSVRQIIQTIRLIKARVTRYPKKQYA